MSIAAVALADLLAVALLAREDRGPRFRRGGAFSTEDDAGLDDRQRPRQSPATSDQSAPEAPDRGPASVSPAADGATPTASTAPLSAPPPHRDAHGGAPAGPALGTYVYRVDGWEAATGFGRRQFPETMTMRASRPDAVAPDEVVFDLDFSSQHEERQVVAYRAGSVAFTFEGGSVTFGPTTQTSEADYDPPMVQVPLPLEPGAARDGVSKAVDESGNTVRTEEWTATVVGRESTVVAGRSVETWVVEVERATTPDSSEQAQRRRTYWYDPGRQVWVKWSEDMHAERNLAGGFTFTYDAHYTATLEEQRT